jgi:hypothetical protein
MKSKIALTIFLLFIFTSTILLASITVASAQHVAPGVAKGDVFECDYKVTWSSTDPSLSPPSETVEANQTQSFQIKITSVTGTTVNADVTLNFRNGSSTTQAGFVELEFGSIHMLFGSSIRREPQRER